MTVDHVKAVTPVGQFVRWQEVFRRRANNKRPEFWYMAQIAFEVMRLRATWVKLEPWEREKCSVDKFLLDFVHEKKSAPPPAAKKELTDEDRREKLAASKSFWGAVTGRTIR
jgi:hypothetical protein